MSAATLLAAARDLDVIVRLEGDGLVATVPKPLPLPAADVVEQIKAHRGEVIEFLRLQAPPPPESRPASRQPKADPWGCPCGERHGVCVFSRRCPLECPCNLCDGWRKGQAWAAAHPRRPVTEQPRPEPPEQPLDERAERLKREFNFSLHHARLAASLNCTVLTPDGPGRLLQLFADRATVSTGDTAKDGQPTVRFYDPGALEVIQ